MHEVTDTQLEAQQDMLMDFIASQRDQPVSDMDEEI